MAFNQVHGIPNGTYGEKFARVAAHGVIVGSSGAVRRLPLFNKMPSNMSGDISVPKNVVWERVKETEKGSQKGGAK